jgi:hypothetical protein
MRSELQERAILQSRRVAASRGGRGATHRTGQHTNLDNNAGGYKWQRKR